MEDLFQYIQGPEPYRVYQRSKADTADIDISGKVVEGSGGVIEVTLTTVKDTVKGFESIELGLERGSFSGSLKNVPVGGPYTIEVSLRSGAKLNQGRKIPGILVGDLWVLAGQSNMDGCGRLVNTEQPSRYVNCFYHGDYWKMAKDPLCWVNESIDPVHWCSQDPAEVAKALRHEKAFSEWGAGLGVRFGKDMFRSTGVPVGLLMCSHGGTSMEQWSPSLRDKGGNSLYGSMIRRINAVEGKVAGCLWYQGESDALTEGWKDYKETFRSFIESLRSDINHPELPFIYVQLSRFFCDDATVPDRWNKVQNDQLLLEREMNNIAFASSIDCTLSDAIHIDAVSQRKMGARMARLAQKLAFGGNTNVGPRPGKIAFVGDDRRQILVSYEEVNGRLRPHSGIRGFTIEKDNIACEIASCKVTRDGTEVLITLLEPVPEGARLWYARGLNPLCTLWDQEGFAAPVFGPVELNTPSRG